MRPVLGAIALLIISSGFAIPQESAPVPSQIVDARKIPVDRGASETWLALKRLRTRASLLMITAHPDDEDGATLAYESRGLGVRTDLLTLNRGEGGANVMSGDLWDSLGLVRTEELLQAGRFYGLDAQYFTTLADYGFSKSLAEALKSWGHDRVLEQAVRVVRETRPLIVCSVFVGGPTDGHGQHATAGLMAQEVFKAAGDPTAFPDQIKAGLPPWTPLKEYARTPFLRTSDKGLYDYATHRWGPVGVQNHITGKWEAGPVSTTVSIPAGAYDTFTGLTYPQISREGLGYQKSQNGGADVPEPNDQSARYHRFGSHIPAGETENSFFDGVDTSLAGIADLAGPNPPPSLRKDLTTISDLLDQAATSFSAQDPSAIAPLLAKGVKATDALVTSIEKSSLSSEQKYNVLHELHIKQRQFNSALLAALGIEIEADIVPDTNQGNIPAEFRGAQQSFQMAIPGQSFHAGVHIYNGGRLPVTLNSTEIQPSSGKDWAVKSEAAAASNIESGKSADLRFSLKVPEDEPYTRPYFTRPTMEQSYYDLSDSSLLDKPFAPYPIAAITHLEFDGVKLTTSHVVQVIDKINGPGTLRFPMPVGPALSVSLNPSAGIIPLGEKSFPLTVRIHDNAEGESTAQIHLQLPSGWTATPQSAAVTFAHRGEDQSAQFTVEPNAVVEKAYEITAVAEANGKRFDTGYTTVGYTGLRPYFLYQSATYKTTGADVKMAPDLKIAYIEGSGDDVPASLEALGLHLSFLSAQDLAAADLNQYDAILLGVRAYAVRPDLIANNGRLLKYVKDGGVVIVQYNTPEFDHNYGPYPYVMTNDPEEVTDENSTVRILDPSNPLLQWPNAITTRDFEGWIEERGSKFLSTWDKRYTPLLETHDAEQDPQEGGLIYARYGKGIYIYNAYAFYRQLPLGVPGAYRIFANMLSLKKNPHLEASR
jgi:LmbE family N-acetylglucosaminyl deacetylase